jgi:hypothetical protein
MTRGSLRGRLERLTKRMRPPKRTDIEVVLFDVEYNEHGQPIDLLEIVWSDDNEGEP